MCASPYNLRHKHLRSLLKLLTEYIQGLLPYRSRDLADFKVDLLAIGISTLLVFIIDICHTGNRN